MNMNNNPTIDQLRALTAKCDDKSAHHVLWVHENGDVFTDPIPPRGAPIDFEEKAVGLKIRYETSAAGNGYVGEDAAKDDKYMGRIYKSLVKEWANAQGTSGQRYIDIF